MPWPKKAPEVFILLDGLDECHADHSDSDADTEKLLSLLMALPNCQLLLTSRHNPTIAKIVHSAMEIGVEHSKADIDVYVAFKVQAVKCLDQAFKREKIDAVQYLGSRANGNFLWAHLVLLEAEKSITMKQFRSVLESPVPHELSQFYQEILDRLEHRRLGHSSKNY